MGFQAEATEEDNLVAKKDKASFILFFYICAIEFKGEQHFYGKTNRQFLI